MKNYSIQFVMVLIAAAAYGALVLAISYPGLSNDAEQYFFYAKNYWHHGTYGIVPGVWDAHREPGYPMFLAALIYIPLKLELSTKNIISILLYSQAFFYIISCAFLYIRATAIPLELRRFLVWTAGGELYGKLA